MSYAKKDFVLQKMLRDSLPYYQVKDEDNKYVIDENNSEKSPEIAKNNLSECLESLEGKFVNVRISDKMFRGEEAQNGTLKAGVFHFRIKLEEAAATNQRGVNGIENTYNSLSIENAKLRDEVNAIRESIRQKEIDDLKLKIKELEKEGKQNNNSAFDTLLMGIGSQILGSNLTEEVKTINDNLDMSDAEIKQDKLNRINAAISILIKHDKDFINNLESLANLAKDNNIVYSMAVAKLKSM